MRLGAAGLFGGLGEFILEEPVLTDQNLAGVADLPDVRSSWSGSYADEAEQNRRRVRLSCDSTSSWR